MWMIESSSSGTEDVAQWCSTCLTCNTDPCFNPQYWEKKKK
jgi:hypothetical protein